MGKGLGKFIAGAAIGAGLGILFAPDTGNNTRKVLKKKLDELMFKVREVDLDEVKDEMLFKIEKLQSELTELRTENSKLKYLVLKKMTEERIKRIYKYADILHCEPIEKVADEFITECSMNNGNYDNIHDCKYRIPDYWDIGEVYERLIEDCFSDDEILHGIWKVYHSWISDKISNYNTDFYYQPRDYIAACYEEGDVL